MDHDDASTVLQPRAVLALIASMMLVGLSFGASSPLVSAILEERGFSEYFTGAVSATLAVSIALGGPWAGRLIARHGPRRVNTIGIVGQGIGFAALGASLAVDEHLLFAARVWLGLAATFTFVSTEVALLSGVRSGIRGRVMAAYGTALAAGFTSGVFLSNPAYESMGLWCFGVVAVVSMPIAYVAWTGMRKAPAAGLEEPHKARGDLSWSPIALAVWGSFAFAVVDGAVSNSYPVEGQRLGLLRSEALGVVGMAALGTMASQLLCGWLADRLGSVRVLCSVAAFGMVAAAVAGLVSDTPPDATRLRLAFLAVGCAIGGVYPVSLKLLAERVSPRNLPRANGRYAAVYGYASFVAPLAAAGGIDFVERIGQLGWALPGLSIVAFALAFPCAVVDRRAAAAA